MATFVSQNKVKKDLNISSIVQNTFESYISDNKYSEILKNFEEIKDGKSILVSKIIKVLNPINLESFVSTIKKQTNDKFTDETIYTIIFIKSFRYYAYDIAKLAILHINPEQRKYLYEAYAEALFPEEKLGKVNVGYRVAESIKLIKSYSISIFNINMAYKERAIEALFLNKLFDAMDRDIIFEAFLTMTDKEIQQYFTINDFICDKMDCFTSLQLFIIIYKNPNLCGKLLADAYFSGNINRIQLTKLFTNVYNLFNEELLFKINAFKLKFDAEFQESIRMLIKKKDIHHANILHRSRLTFLNVLKKFIINNEKKTPFMKTYDCFFSYFNYYMNSNHVV